MAMWNCKHCDGKIAANANSCPHCGATFNRIEKGEMHAVKMANEGGCVVPLTLMLGSITAFIAVGLSVLA